MAKGKKYFGRGARSFGRARRYLAKKGTAIMGVVFLGTLGAELLGRGSSGKVEYAGSPAGYLAEKNWGSAVSALARNATDLGTYVVPAVVGGAWVVVKAAGGSRLHVTKKLTVA